MNTPAPRTTLEEDLVIGDDSARLWMCNISTSEWTVSVTVTLAFAEGQYETTLIADRELGLRFEGNLSAVD